MLTVNDQLQNIDHHITTSIAKSTLYEVGHLSQDVLSNLRNLVEACIVALASNNCSVEFIYAAIEPAKKMLNGRPECKFLLSFHHRLQSSVSHYTLDEDASKRLMLRYVEYLYRLRKLMQGRLGVAILGWLESFPTVDPSQLEYQRAIAEAVDYCMSMPRHTVGRERYYVWRTVPFFCNGAVYYEVTLTPARDELLNTDRFTVFTSHEIPRYYAVKVAICRCRVSVYNSSLPLQVVTGWEASARPCELSRLARILGIDSYEPATSSSGYRALMRTLQYRMSSLREIASLDKRQYQHVLAALQGAGGGAEIRLLGALREAISCDRPGHNVICYLSHYLRNGVLKGQHNVERCNKLGGLYLKYGAIPFDEMPLCTSLCGHNPSLSDVVSSIGADGRDHELLAAYLKSRALRDGEVFIDKDDVPFDDVDELIGQHNEALYFKHREQREIRFLGDCLYISEYADDAISVLDALASRLGTPAPHYRSDVERFLSNLPPAARYNDEKKLVLRRLFSKSTVAIVYGSAGTGKSTFVSLVTDFMQGRNMLFLAWTHAAVENLQRRVGAGAGTFMTVASALRRTLPAYDLVVIDECSTIPNADMKRLLETVNGEYLLLVGDDCQIGSITFGNWFELAKKGRLRNAVFILKETFRTSDEILLKLWRMVREYDVLLEEHLVKHGFVEHLGPEVFRGNPGDQVTLCLSYNGLYGVNNINRILQQANQNAGVEWGRRVYKVGDPILFGNSSRFDPVIHSNTRGVIRGIDKREEQIFFDIEVQSHFSASFGADLRWIANPTSESTLVRINVFRGDDDLDDANLQGRNTTVVPFQIAYAVSIHKAQGLEYESVRLVIPNEVDEFVTRDIFYTGISRAKKSLKIYWTPGTQKRIVERFADKDKRVRTMDKEFGRLRQLAAKNGVKL